MANEAPSLCIRYHALRKFGILNLAEWRMLPLPIHLHEGVTEVMRASARMPEVPQTARFVSSR